MQLDLGRPAFCDSPENSAEPLAVTPTQAPQLLATLVLETERTDSDE